MQFHPLRLHVGLRYCVSPAPCLCPYSFGLDYMGIRYSNSYGSYMFGTAHTSLASAAVEQVLLDAWQGIERPVLRAAPATVCAVGSSTARRVLSESAEPIDVDAASIDQQESRVAVGS